MTPEIIAGAVAALITAGPSYIALRRARGSAREEGEATRQAVSTAVENAVNVLTVKVEEARYDIRRLEEWQTAHTAEHLLLRRNER